MTDTTQQTNALTRSQERAKLHAAIWNIANQLRGSVTGWNFMNYVLGTIFYRFISEDFAHDINENERAAGATDFDYALLTDDEAQLNEDERMSLINQKGYFILPSQLFCNLCEQIKSDDEIDNLNVTLQTIFHDIEATARGTSSEEKIRGLFSSFDVSSEFLGKNTQQRNQKLREVLFAIRDMDLGNTFTETSNDTFGDAYEYLISMYAANAGRSGGEFFTPQEVSRLLALLAINGRHHIRQVYDPACGSGSLLLQMKKILGNEVEKFIGQEINVTTYNLCRINMFLHGVDHNNFDIQNDDTLLHPQHRDLEPFDAIVSNPPYSIHWIGSDDPTLINDDRYSPAGVLAPKGKADLAFTMHMLHSLDVSGTAAIVEFPGVLYRGGAEQKIREYLLRENYIDAVIQLPQNLFFGVSIATCIIVLKKSKRDNKILFIDASQEFVHEGNKNKLTEENIQRIYQTVQQRTCIDHFSTLVDATECIEQQSNLSVSTYVEPEDTTEHVDIAELNQQIAEIVARQSELRQQLDAIIAQLEGGQQ